MTLAALRTAQLASILWLAISPVAFAAVNELTPTEKSAGWRLLFDGQTTAGWRSFRKQTFPAKGWLVEDGWFHCLGKDGGDIITGAEFESFEFTWEWRIATNGNSGVKYLITETRTSAIGHEYQLIDDDRNDDAKLRDGRRVTASLYDLIKPAGARPKPPGDINQSRLLVRGNHVEHWLNGVRVLEYDCGSDALKAAVAGSKYKNTAGFGDRIKGHLLLQDHHCDVWFRNLKLRELN